MKKTCFEESKQNVSKTENKQNCVNSAKSGLKTSKNADFVKHPLVFIGVGMEIGAILRLHFTPDPQHILGLRIAVIIGVFCIVIGWTLGRISGMGNKISAAKCHKAERCKYGKDCPRKYVPQSDWFACFVRNKINTAESYKLGGKKKGG